MRVELDRAVSPAPRRFALTAATSGGPKLLSEALDAAWPVETVFVETAALGRPAVADAVARSAAADLAVWEMSICQAISIIRR